MTYVDNMLLSTSESFNGYTITTYNGYSADRFTVRKISTRVPTVSFANNAAVMNATRLSDQLDADFMIADAIRDQRGNLLQSIDGRGMITQSTFDSLGRQVTTVRGQNTASPLTSSTAYNARGQVESTTDAAEMVSFTEYDDALKTKSRTVAYGTPQALTSSYTYDAKGRQKTMTDSAGAVTTNHYDDCWSDWRNKIATQAETGAKLGPLRFVDLLDSASRLTHTEKLLARQNRSEIFDAQKISVMHCINRAVRRAMLCGIDRFSGKSYEHRRDWIKNRIGSMKKVGASRPDSRHIKQIAKARKSHEN